MSPLPHAHIHGARNTGVRVHVATRTNALARSACCGLLEVRSGRQEWVGLPFVRWDTFKQLVAEVAAEPPVAEPPVIDLCSQDSPNPSPKPTLASDQRKDSHSCSQSPKDAVGTTVDMPIQRSASPTRQSIVVSDSPDRSPSPPRPELLVAESPGGKKNRSRSRSPSEAPVATQAPTSAPRYLCVENRLPLCFNHEDSYCCADCCTCACHYDCWDDVCTSPRCLMP